MPHNRADRLGCTPTGPDETRTSRPHPTEGVCHSERMSEAWVRIQAARTALAAWPNDPTVTTRVLAILDSAAGWLE